MSSIMVADDVRRADFGAKNTSASLPRRLRLHSPSSILNHPTVAQSDDPMTVGGVGLGMSDLDDRRSLTIELPEQLHDLASLVGMQVAGRFVGENQGRFSHDGPRHRHELLLTARQLAGKQIL